VTTETFDPSEVQAGPRTSVWNYRAVQRTLVANGYVLLAYGLVDVTFCLKNAARDKWGILLESARTVMLKADFDKFVKKLPRRAD
jgi:hypothetical protein